jgi:cytochrome c-type biogenesis protein CcmH
MKRSWLAVLIILMSGLALAVDPGDAFEDPEMQARYEKISSEVRCLVCQNQTIKDSNAFLAADLKREIRRLMVEGKTDAEIYDFLVARYGDFVLYSPRKSGKTLVLWIAPFLFIAIGGVVALRVVRGRMTMSTDDDTDSDPATFES